MKTINIYIYIYIGYTFAGFFEGHYFLVHYYLEFVGSGLPFWRNVLVAVLISFKIIV